MALSVELIVLALAGYAFGLALGAGSAQLWSLRGSGFRVNARERKL
tara:strand:+ start:1306 stop:1443 length:138 start_codon:yes stop_codon:yes gene_type:complete